MERRNIGFERDERKRRRREEKEKKVTRAGIEPTAAAPSQPTRLDVSRSDHSAASKETASCRALRQRFGLTRSMGYRFKRNVRGLISAGDEHNRRGEEALKGIENIVKVVEDVLIFDNDFDAHVERVRQVFLGCNEAGITLHHKQFVFAEP